MVAGAAHHRTPVATVRPSEEEITYLKRPIRALYLKARETVMVLRTEALMTVTRAARGTWCVGATTA